MKALRLKTYRFFLLTVILMGVLSPAPRPVEAALSMPANFITETVIDGLTSPTTIAFAPDGRIFIGLKSGVVRVFQNGVLLPTPFIDISSQVNNYWDRGLLGITLHPNFPTIPYVYLLYTYDPPGAPDNGSGSRVSRLMRVSASAANSNVADVASAVILMGTNSTYQYIGDVNSTTVVANPSCFDQTSQTPVQDCIPSDSPSHSIGTVTFSPDGSALFVGTGDGAHFNFTDKRALRSLQLNSMAGKIFRIDPITGQGLPSNPFYDGDPNSNRSKVYNLGLRNPFRFTIHPQTGIPYIGDVGWNSWEEINTGIGKNFGWPCYEGGPISSLPQGSYQYNSGTKDTCAALYAQGAGAVQQPLYAYSHDGASSSAQVGAFYTGTTYPTQYQGALFYSDYNRDTIYYLTFDGNGVPTSNTFASDLSSGGPVQVIAGPDTNLYYVLYNPGNNTSTVQRIRFIGSGNNRPIAAASADPSSGAAVPLQVNFSSSGTYDPDSDALTYAWTFGDGGTASSMNPSHTYTTQGIYYATLTVTDPSNLSSSAQVRIVAGNTAPTAAILTPVDGTKFSVDDIISFSGTGTDPEDGNLPGAQMEWEVLLHHFEHVHFDYFNFTGSSGTFVAPDHGDNTWIELCLTVTDSFGLTDSACQFLPPNLVNYTFNTVPTGMQFAYEGIGAMGPFNVDTIVNSVADVDAPETQGCFQFSSWSDGGARSRQIIIGSTPQTYTLSYTGVMPANWQYTDIGSVGLVGGSCAAANNQFTVKGAGAGTAGASDSFQFAYTTAGTEGGIQANILGSTNLITTATAGVMYRSSLAADAPFIQIYLGNTGSVKLQYRATAGAVPTIASSQPTSTPVAVKILRNGNSFKAYYANAGVWNDLGAVNISMPPNALVGLASSSQTPTSINTASFVDVYLMQNMLFPLILH